MVPESLSSGNAEMGKQFFLVFTFIIIASTFTFYKVVKTMKAMFIQLTHMFITCTFHYTFPIRKTMITKVCT